MRYLVFPRRSFGTTRISTKITKFAKRAGLKYLVGVSRDVSSARLVERERRRGEGEIEPHG